MRAVRTPTVDEVLDARHVVARHLRPTPVVESADLGNVVLKLETLQPTGSFKVRGALVAVAKDPSAQLVTASAGNHGLGVAFAATAYGASATVVVPENASPVKQAALSKFAITLRAEGSSYDDAERIALELAGEGAHFISPYNDPDTIAGQGSIALELFDDVDDLTTIVVPIGGGGLISGIALTASAHPHVKVVGVEASASPAVRSAIEGRAPIEIRPTLADGLAGNLETGSITVDLCRRYVDDIVDVSEDEIEEAMRFVAKAHGLMIEGSAAVGVAALMAGRVPAGQGTTAVVLTGRNIALDVFARVISS